MSFAYQDTTLFDGPTLKIVDIDWHVRDSRPSREFQSPLAEISFQRAGMFVKNHGRRRVACDPNTLVFINADEPYRLTHPTSMHCTCMALLLDRDVLAGMVSTYEPAAVDRRDRLFAFDDCPKTAELGAAQRGLLSLIRSQSSADPLAIEELGLNLAQQVIETSYRFHARRSRAVRPSTARAHAETIHNVKELLGARYRERLALGDIAESVHCAPSHLCRLFKQQTGSSMHRYLNRLRLADALERLADPDISLSQLALELGFSHHSHFTTVFQREIGMSPSRLRRDGVS